MTETTKPTFSGWAIVELMGHRVEAGYVSEEVQFGVAMCRIDCYAPGDDAPFMTRYYPGGSLYGFTPTSEEAARQRAEYLKPRKPAVLELPDGRHDDDDVCGDDDLEF